MPKFLTILVPAALTAALVGCNNQNDAKPYADADKAPAEHAHHHEGPHGGHVIELTDDHTIHGEFVIDKEAKLAVFYLLGEDLKTPVEGTAVTMHATTADGDTEIEFQPADGKEKASKFTIALDKLPSSDIESLEAHFHVTAADGKSLAGGLAHDHGHEHEEEKTP